MEKRAAVAELCCHKTNFLNLNYLYAQFIQDASEVSADNDEHAFNMVVKMITMIYFLGNHLDG